MSNEEKWITILGSLLLLLILAGAGVSSVPDPEDEYFQEKMAMSKTDYIEYDTDADRLKNAALGGVAGRMPDNSSKIMFESLTGRKLKSYTGYDNIEETVYALKSGRVDAIWVCDATADYLMQTDEYLYEIESDGMSSLQNAEGPRFSFAMAVADNSKGKELAEQLNGALDYLEKNGILKELCRDYIDCAASADYFGEKDMIVHSKTYRGYYYSEKPIYIGVTGAVPPIELLDASGRPYGFCVALMDEIGQVMQRGVEFVVLDNETAFSSLMAGKVDAIFCYGTGRITTEGSKSWYMTEPYAEMEQYKFLRYVPF